MSDWIKASEELPKTEGPYLLRKEGSDVVKEGCFGEIDGQKGFYDWNGWIYPDYWKHKG